MTDQPLTTREKRQARIAQLEARLQKEKARFNSDKRKERNGQLIAFGIYLEEFLKTYPGKIPSMKQSMQEFLDGRNLDRALAAWERIVKQVDHQTGDVRKKDLEKNKIGSSKEEISPEPPSQLPEAVAQEKNQGSA